ncbi:MAG: DUF222 domain-containing protein [Acidimicrobiaceae bacterium]|nr:DUF222 domain-containing protein [Acidimicrobiaceae bacterium]
MDVTPLWHDVLMGISTARRVREGLAELIRFVNDPSTATSDLKMVLAECGSFGGQLAVLQADAAAGVAARECHGDGGVGALARAAGLFKRDAASQVKTVEKLQEMSAVRDALESGEISVANAKTLATACEKTSAEQVEQDGDLLAQAAVLSPEQFAREAGRWAARRQVDDGEERYRRQRARRRLSFWDGDDGMVHLRGELDPVTGAKVRKRFSQEAERLRRADLHGAGGDKRSLDQRMADALETLSSYGSIYSRAAGATPAGCGCTGAHTDGSSGESAPESGSDSDGRGGGQAGDGVVSRSGGDVSRARNASSSLTGGGRCGCGSPPSADVTIVQHLDADGTEAFAEVAGGGVIPQSVLEEHFCNARITGVVFSSEGVPLWHGHAKRLATKAQMNALRARYGACGGCGADMWICQGHHVRPVLRGGPTNIDNMMLVCWACHQKIHHHGWREVPDGRGLYTIAPPERIRHGPAHAPDPPPAHGPSSPQAATQARPLFPVD